MRDRHNVFDSRSSLKSLQRNAVAASADRGHNGALSSACNVRLKTALFDSINYVLKLRFRRTCCHVDDHENSYKKAIGKYLLTTSSKL
jgi:hypothetical protein